MKGLVISWFFPPATSAEGLVTFKLLKNSCFDYDVVSAQSRQWSYSADTALTSRNIQTHPVAGERLTDFVKEGAALAKRLCKENGYAFIMTRAMPPQSHEIALRLRPGNKGKKLLWIASMADPIARNPYDYDRYFNCGAAEMLRRLPLTAARFFIYQRNKRFESRVIRKADLLIFPSEEQCRFTLAQRYEQLKEKCLILPHSFDRDIIPQSHAARNTARDKIVISHLGHLNRQRNANGLIRAVAQLKADRSELAEKLLIRFVGNIPREQKAMIENSGLGGIIRTEEPVDYFQSLKIMDESDILLLIDADFSFMSSNIFFASKLADYMGAGKPILGLTTKEGPSGRIIQTAGYPVCGPDDDQEILKCLTEIVTNGVIPPRDDLFCEYESRKVARTFDKRVEQLLNM